MEEAGAKLKTSAHHKGAVNSSRLNLNLSIFFLPVLVRGDEEEKASSHHLAFLTDFEVLNCVNKCIEVVLISFRKQHQHVVLLHF